MPEGLLIVSIGSAPSPAAVAPVKFCVPVPMILTDADPPSPAAVLVMLIFPVTSMSPVFKLYNPLPLMLRLLVTLKFPVELIL